MFAKTTYAIIGAGLLAASPALAAVTITNQDSKPHTIVIDHGKDSQQQQVAANASVTASCPDKCGFRDLAFGTSRLAGGNAKLVIDKDGELHFQDGSGDFVMPNGSK